ncbi:hypothetical protein D3C84_1080080 [compost metagenome]
MDCSSRVSLFFFKCPECAALNLACLGLGQRVDELNGAWIFIGSGYLFDVFFQMSDQFLTRLCTRTQYHESLDDFTPFLMWRSNDRAFKDAEVREQGVFNFGWADAVAR